MPRATLSLLVLLAAGWESPPRLAGQTVPDTDSVVHSTAMRAASADEEGLRVVRVIPAAGARNVARDVSIRIHTSEAFDPASVGPASVRLLVARGTSVPAVRTTDLGGVISLSPVQPLEPDAAFVIEVTAKLTDRAGRAATPFRSRFRTGRRLAVPPGGKLPPFDAERLTAERGLTAVTAGPDGHIYAATWTGTLLRYVIDETSGDVLQRQRLHQLQPGRILSLAFDPDAAPERLDLWVTYDSHAGQDIPGGRSSTQQSYDGVLARWALPRAAENSKVRETVYIRGFPAGDHPVGSCVFGPDGRAYISQGAMTMHGAGTSPDHFETPVSAAVLVADVRSPDFNAGRLPLDITTLPPVNYDPFAEDAPLQVYATGIREAYDLCWHSNGQLYAGVNMNDTPQPTPARNGVPALEGLHPPELLIRIVEGAYYGFPNPAIDRYVVLGGNPTSGTDPWEISRYAIGTQPEPDFHPEYLIFNLAQVGGDSANGCIEYRHPGPLLGRLLICFYTSARTIGTFEFTEDGTRVASFDHLRGRDGQPLRFGAPLDITVDAKGRIYVADFEDPRRGDSGTSGGLWRVTLAED